MRRAAASLVFLLAFQQECEADSLARPALLRRPAEPIPTEPSRRELIAAKPTAQSPWHEHVIKWGEKHASATWFPCVLAFIGFMDPFTLCGFLVMPLLTLALLVSELPRALVLCASVWGGCLAGNFAFVALIGRLGLAAKLADSPHLEVARELLTKHGPVAGVMNTILPLPTVPLMVAAHVLKADETLIVLALAVGRAVRYVVLCSTIVGGRSAYKFAKAKAKGQPPAAQPHVKERRR